VNGALTDGGSVTVDAAHGELTVSASPEYAAVA
jgi:hypothetical protein